MNPTASSASPASPASTLSVSSGGFYPATAKSQSEPQSQPQQRWNHPMRRPSTKALILQQKQREEQTLQQQQQQQQQQVRQHATLPRSDTADSAMLSHVSALTASASFQDQRNMAPAEAAAAAAAALRERSNSLAVLQSMRSNLPGSRHTMDLKSSSKLAKEMTRAAKVVETFFSPKLLKDQSIPRELLAEANGLVFVTTYKVGFLLSGKVGTGFVLTRTTGGWSAPCFLSSGGLGFGMMAGGEMVNYMIILNSRSAVKVFTRNGQVQLGSELDIAVGPIGRAASASLNVGVGGVAPNYSYSHSKGLYGGIGLTGAVICTRKSLNARCYGRDVTARQILGGEVACPLAEPLWRALDTALGAQREYRDGLPVLAPTYTGLACDACGFMQASERNPNACARCGNLLVYSVSVHSGRRNTSQLVASSSMDTSAA